MPAGPKRPMPRQCPRCAGPLYPGYDDDLSCLFCGEYLFANLPERPAAPAPPPAQPGPRKRGRPRKNPAAA
ncbi:MAG TPA: hypothetical protein VKZ60_06870 [Chloroflexota bacterium]|jgi:hypothetical protein|nr:hypothetical protein [Chloroflexota bacterium]